MNTCPNRSDREVDIQAERKLYPWWKPEGTKAATRRATFAHVAPTAPTPTSLATGAKSRRWRAVSAPEFVLILR